MPALLFLFGYAREGSHTFNFRHTRSCQRVSILKNQDGFPIKNVENDGLTGFPLSWE